jgi:hypothetical protein
MKWLLQNWETIFAIWGMLVAFCTAIVRLTPTQKDDTFLAKVVKWADVFSVVFTKEDAETIAKALEKKKK